MVLVVSEKAWTFRLYSILLLHNMISAESWQSDDEKGSYFLSSKTVQKNYQFEDFFWTGSGDGTLTDEMFRNDTYDTIIMPESFLDTRKTTTVFHTTTILFATVYPDHYGCFDNDCTPKISPITTKSIDYSLPASFPQNVPEVQPTPSVKIFQFLSPKISSSLQTVNIATNTTGVQMPLPTIKSFPTNNFFNSNFESYPTQNFNEINATTAVFPETFLDQKYWILTILKNDENSAKMDVNKTEQKLTNLYRQAFNRRKEEYFGNSATSNQKEVETVKAHIINITSIGTDIGLVYSITMSGRPIPANTASSDMRLMTLSEIIAELGRPVFTKAEPYANIAVSPRARVKGKVRDTWLLIGCIIAAICLLLLLVGGLVLILSKKRNKKKSKNTEKKRGACNMAFDEDTDSKAEYFSKSPRTSKPKTKEQSLQEESVGATVKFKEDRRESSTSSSNSSGSTETDLVRLQNQQVKREKRKESKERPRPKLKPRTRERRIQNSDFRNNDCRQTYIARGTSIMSKSNFNDSASDEYSPRVTRTPTCYLSMPSVKAFPRRTKIPDPMNKILEPTSIRHLDADSDSQRESNEPKHFQKVQAVIEHDLQGTRNKFSKEKGMTRHPSLEGEDPGVIGPLVWNKHCRKMARDTDLLNDNQGDIVNARRIRKRFNELLNEALNMAESNNEILEGTDLECTRQPENRVHSAVIRAEELNVAKNCACRPNTTGSKKPTMSGPKGAWETPSSFALARPLCSCKHQEVSISPVIDKNLIYVNSELSPSDPAIPLIAAIKSELKKFEFSLESNNPE